MLDKFQRLHNSEEWHLLGCYIFVALVRTDVSEELSASITRVTRISELGT
jgi:sarcosine oxidase delta subunit